MRNVSLSRNIAEMIHRMFPQQLPYDPKAVITGLGGKCVPFTVYKAAETGYPTDLFEAEAVKPDPSHTMQIDYAGWKPKERVKFTIASELGYLLLFALQMDGTILMPNDRSPRTIEEAVCADEFAAEFLMPASDFVSACKDNAKENEGKINAENVATIFGVTKNAVLVRGSRLGVW